MFGMASKRSSRRDSARRRLPLSVRLSLLVLFAAIVPLAAVVGINDYFARGTLIDQGRSALTTDAQAKMSLVDTYMHERLLDGQALASLPTAPAYLACIAATQLPDAQAAALDAKLNCLDPQLGLAFYQGSNQRALCVGLVRDTNYTTWSIYTARGQALLSFGQHDPNAQCPENHSGLSVPKEDLQQVQQGKPFVSAVYKSGDSAYVNLYTPIAVPLLDPQKPTVLGFLQARLKLDYIWYIVNHENRANGAVSYAFITDANGVRIASSKPEDLFTAVAPPDSATHQLITSEQRYGSGKTV